MSLNCPPAPENKKEFISDIGKILVRDYGKKKYYKPQEVKESYKKSTWFDGIDFSCWAMSAFSSRSDFNKYHRQTGEVCDFAEMKKEMIQGLSISEKEIEISDFDIDVSWMDFGDIIGDLAEGIAELIGGIIGGIFEL